MKIENPYQVLGTEIATLRGRAKFIKQLQRQLLKPNPEHISVIGAQMIGKTTFLYHFAEDFPCEGSDYLAALYWDLAHESPTDDEAFRAKLADVLTTGLTGRGSDDWPDLEAEFERADPKGLVEGVVGKIGKSGKRILLIMDGMDYALARGSFSRNIFDWLRSQAGTEGLRIVTGSRLALGDLCKSEDSRDSEFWNMFYPKPMVLAAFDDDDWEEVLQPIHDQGIVVEDEGLATLKSWTGGVPVFVSGILNELCDLQPDEGMSSKTIDGIGHAMIETPPTFLSRLWRSCGEDLQKWLVALVTEKPDGKAVGPRTIKKLTDMGLAHEEQGRVESTCELMTRHAAEESGTVVQLDKLFAQGESYRSSIGTVIEKRFSQIQGGDADLRKYVDQAIKIIESDPASSIGMVRKIVDRARRLILDAELPNAVDERTRRVPDEAIEYWKMQNPGGPRGLYQNRTVSKPHEERTALSMLTGGQKIDPKAKNITKPTYLLFAGLSEIWGTAGHTEDYDLSPEYAASVCLSAVELFSALSRELP